MILLYFIWKTFSKFDLKNLKDRLSNYKTHLQYFQIYQILAELLFEQIGI